MDLKRPELDAAAERVYGVIAPTPQIAWPLLSTRCGAEIWVKHENHTVTGSFKIRGGVAYLGGLRERCPRIRGVVAATRGNHGQSVALAARLVGLTSRIVVPHGNSLAKNSAIEGFGASLVRHGYDFQEAYEYAQRIAQREDLHFVPSFDLDLVKGVASYALELFEVLRKVDAVYVPVGLGSGICAVIAVRDALNLRTDVIGVVAERAPAYAYSFEQRKLVTTDSADTLADGLAVRVPDERALETIWNGAARIVQVSEAEIRNAIRIYFSDTHQLAEGAGAAPLAAVLQEGGRMKGRRIALILSGGNIDRDLYQRILAEET